MEITEESSGETKGEVEETIKLKKTEMAEAEYSNFQTKLEVCQHEKKKKLNQLLKQFSYSQNRSDLFRKAVRIIVSFRH